MSDATKAKIRATTNARWAALREASPAALAPPVEDPELKSTFSGVRHGHVVAAARYGHGRRVTCTCGWKTPDLGSDYALVGAFRDHRLAAPPEAPENRVQGIRWVSQRGNAPVEVIEARRAAARVDDDGRRIAEDRSGSAEAIGVSEVDVATAIERDGALGGSTGG